MKITADYHMHTKFSDGLGTIEEMVKIAKAKGLKEIAITDHGFFNKYFPLLRKEIPIIKREIEHLKNKYDINILFGVEANLISRAGDIDLREEDKEFFDIILLVFHKHTFAKSLNEWLYFILPNFFAMILKNSKKRIKINTNAYLNAIKKHKIHTLVHLGEHMKVDLVKIAKSCKKNNIYLEFNNKHKVNYDRIIKELIGTKVTFILNSDAHNTSSVGECSSGVRYLLKYNIPINQLANVK